MNLPSWRRILVALATTMLAGALFAGPAQAQTTVPNGPVVIFSYAHSNYLLPDDGVGGLGTLLQVYWHENHPYKRTFSFRPVAGEPNTFHWKYEPSGRCLDAGRATEGRTSVTHQTCTNNKSQWWYVLPVRGTNRWAIKPYLDTGLAVTSEYGNDNWAPLREVPGPNNVTAAQQWYLRPE